MAPCGNTTHGRLPSDKQTVTSHGLTGRSRVVAIWLTCDNHGPLLIERPMRGIAGEMAPRDLSLTAGLAKRR
jgi:hypothetical protein